MNVDASSIAVSMSAHAMCLWINIKNKILFIRFYLLVIIIH